MNDTIVVRVKDVYGRPMIYPVCEAAHRFASIAGTKTLSESVLASVRAIGFRVTVTREPELWEAVDR